LVAAAATTTAWRVAVTPKRGAIKGTPATKTFKIRAAR
jgi:hypothetical protein